MATDSVALAALVVAIVALAITTLQALQQYASTADGYRRCQAAVMGKWSRFTHRRLRFWHREFRFETTFVVPRIGLQDFTPGCQFYNHADLEDTHDETTLADLVGDEEKGSKPLRSRHTSSTVEDEKAGWLLLLRDLERSFGRHKEASAKQCKSDCNFCRKMMDDKLSKTEKQDTHDIDRGVSSNLDTSEKHLKATKWPGTRHYPHLVNDKLLDWVSEDQPIRLPFVTALRKSWDYVPPDVLKPLAVTDANSLFRIGHMLGMIWSVFNPGTGEFRAGGTDRAFISYQIQGVGTVVQYLHTIQNDTTEVSAGVHSSTDLLACGIIRPYLLVNHEFNINQPKLVERCLNDFFQEHVGREAPKKAVDLIERRPRHKWAGPLNDLVPLTMPFLGHRTAGTDQRPHEKIAIVIPYPLPGVMGVVGYMFDVFLKHALRYFSRRSKIAIDLDDQVAYNQIEDLKDPKERAFLIAWRRKFVQTSFEKTFEECEDFLQNSPAFDRSFGCYVLLCGHLEFVYTTWDHYDGMVLPKRLDHLFSHLSELTKLVHDEWRKQRGHARIPDVETIEDAWIIMMLRAYCWRQLHKMVKCETMEEDALSSRLPIYLT